MPWTTRLLTKHVWKHCETGGHASLAKLGRGTVSKILSANRASPIGGSHCSTPL